MGLHPPRTFEIVVEQILYHIGFLNVIFYAEKNDDMFICTATLSGRIPFVGEAFECCIKCASNSAAKRVYFFLLKAELIPEDDKDDKPCKDNFCVESGECFRESMSNYGSWYQAMADSQGNDLHPFPAYDASDDVPEEAPEDSSEDDVEDAPQRTQELFVCNNNNEN